MVVIIGLFDKGAGDRLALAVEHVVYDLLCVDGHSQGTAYALIVKGRTAQIVTDIGIAERGA